MQWIKDTGSPLEWMDSHEAARLIHKHENADLKVAINGCLIPVANVYFHHNARTMIVELVDSSDESRRALNCGSCGGPTEGHQPH